MSNICAEPDLWATSLFPEGVLDKWLKPDGAYVETGEAVAALRIEGALHELLSPADGWLSIDRKANSVIEPGAVLGHIGRDRT